MYLTVGISMLFIISDWMVGNNFYIRLSNILVLNVNGISIRVRNWHFF